MRCPRCKFIRDATRGGLATVLNEIADARGSASRIDEAAIPLREDVKGFCEILGLDPLYLANEGKHRRRGRRPRGRTRARARCARIRLVATPPSSAESPRGRAGG